MKGTRTTHRPDEKPLNAGLLLSTSRSLAHSYRHRTDRVLDDRPWNTHADERWERSAVFHDLRTGLGCCAGITVYAGAAVAGLAAVLAASATAFHQGLLSNLPNPKIALIFLTLIPQFISMGEPASTTTVALAAAFSPAAIVWWRVFSLAVGTLGRMLSRERVRIRSDRPTSFHQGEHPLH